MPKTGARKQSRYSLSTKALSDRPTNQTRLSAAAIDASPYTGRGSNRSSTTATVWIGAAVAASPPIDQPAMNASNKNAKTKESCWIFFMAFGQKICKTGSAAATVSEDTETSIFPASSFQRKKQRPIHVIGRHSSTVVHKKLTSLPRKSPESSPSGIPLSSAPRAGPWRLPRPRRCRHARRCSAGWRECACR